MEVNPATGLSLYLLISDNLAGTEKAEWVEYVSSEHDSPVYNLLALLVCIRKNIIVT